MTFPNTVEEFMALLEELQPEPDVRPGDSHDAIIFNAGRRSLVTQIGRLRGGAVAAPLRELRGTGRVRRQNS